MASYTTKKVKKNTTPAIQANCTDDPLSAKERRPELSEVNSNVCLLGSVANVFKGLPDILNVLRGGIHYLTRVFSAFMLDILCTKHYYRKLKATELFEGLEKGRRLAVDANPRQKLAESIHQYGFVVDDVRYILNA